jgi:hypothetical protein
MGGHPVDIRSRVDIRADDVPDGINAADHPAGLSFSRMRPRLRSCLLHVGDLVREDRIEHVRSFERDLVAAVFDNHVLIPPSRNTRCSGGWRWRPIPGAADDDQVAGPG